MNREIKFRLLLKAKIDFGTLKEGEILTMVAPVFDEKNGLAFLPIETKEWELLSYDQYTGLKDKAGVVELYEGDVVSLEGIKLGNIYENKHLLENDTNIVIKELGTSEWENSYKEAYIRGCRYAK